MKKQSGFTAVKVVVLGIISSISLAGAFAPPNFQNHLQHHHNLAHSSSVVSTTAAAAVTNVDTGAAIDAATTADTIFEDFVTFLLEQQSSIIADIEALEQESGRGSTFGRDTWGSFSDTLNENVVSAAPRKSGGITRVIQGGSIVEKGACSLTLIRDGVLSAERAATMQERQDATAIPIAAGDIYSAAALSMVLHTKSPLVPTFRSDVRIFLVRSATTGETMAWFGGGADLTPYYFEEEDISNFHRMYRDLCQEHLSSSSSSSSSSSDTFSYQSMKQACDHYFYLPARAEHRGTGGIFFDDMFVTSDTLPFVQGVVHTWMPSWFPIVQKHATAPYTEQQKYWQMLRRGRYLEFNLLYDRGVKFGLANANPRVEGVMVSAPPQIAFEYNHQVKEGSPEAALMKILKQPRDWV